jgi:acyl transferase domain-containing protein
LLGDAVEVRALSKAFGAATQRQGFCALGSVKSNVGHLDAAAGVTGLIKVVLSLKHGMLPPSLHYEEPNPQIDFRHSPFYVNTQLKEWKRESGPRRAGVSAFGVGGTNAHVVVEEAPEPGPGEKGRSWQLLTLSARTETALQQGMKNLLKYLEPEKPEKPEEAAELADVGYTLQVGRKVFGWRWSGVCRSREEAVEQLRGGMAAGSEGGVEEGGRKVAFLFPGQGNQYAGMGAELYENEGVFRRSLQESSEILKPHLGTDLCRALYEERTAEVNETYLAQPALVAVEYGLVELWKSWGVEPEAMLGHSVGEYTAAWVAGVMSREEVLGVVAARGRLMQEMERGGMVAVALGEKELGWAEEKGFSIAAVNAPGMSVLAGGVKEIEEVERELQVRGVEYKRLRTSHAFHSRLVEPMMGAFLEEMKKVKLKAPEKRFISNVTGSWIRDEEARDPGYWVKHLRERVQFGRGVKELVESGEWMLVESGPGQSLRRLAQRQGAGGMTVSSLPGMAGEGRGESETAAMLGAVGRLWQEGIGINWSGLHAGTRRLRVPLPTYPFERKRYWIEPASQLKQTRTATPASPKKIFDVSQWFWQPSWKLSSAKPVEYLQPQAETAWLVFIDDGGLGLTVAARLEDNGHRVIKVSKGEKFRQNNAFSYTIAPSRSSDYAELISSLHNAGWRVGNLLHLWGMDSEVQEESKPELFIGCEENGLLSLLYIVQALAAQGSEGRHHVWVAGSNTIQVESTDRVMPEKTGSLAFCKVLPQEDQSFVTHGIDISPIRCAEDLDAAAERLFRELQAPASDAVAAWRGPNRWVQTYESIPVPQTHQPSSGLKTEGVYMITGGLGAVGLLLAEWIARAVRGKLLLVGRSAIPPRSKWEEMVRQAAQPEQSRRLEKLLALERMGAEVEIVQADVCNVMQMRQVVERCRERFGGLDGVIHGAGITSGPSVFRLARDVRAEDCETQAGPKAVGLMVLEEVLAGSDVDFVMCLSSNASVLGGLGFTAYAAANLFMDAFVQRKQFENCKTRWLSTNWDHWPEETKKIANVHTTLDEFAMTREEAEQAFFTALGLGLTGQIIVATGDLQQRANLWINQQQWKESAESKSGFDTQARAPRPKVRTAYVEPENEAEQALAAIWQESLGVEKIGVNDDFFELGGHSLLATKFLVQIREVFGVDFPLAKFFEGPTIAQMASYLMELAEEEVSPTDEPFTARSAVG